MEKYSLKQIVEDVIDVITNNSVNIQTVEYVEIFEYNNAKAKDYPKVLMALEESGELGDNSNTANVTFLFIDVMGGRLNQTQRDYEIKSDMQLEASMLFDKLQSEGYIINLPISYDPITGFYDDKLSGVTCTVTFNLAKPCYEV